MAEPSGERLQTARETLKRLPIGLSLSSFTQERIVLAIAIALFIACSVFLHNFLTPANIVVLLRNVAVLCILGIAMAIVVIGRGVDLSLIAVMAIAAGWTLKLIADGHSIGMSLGLGFVCALAMGVANGLLVAFAEIPALFATLATGIFLYGFGKGSLIGLDVVYLPKTIGWVAEVGKGMIGPLPMPLVLAGAFIVLAYGFLRHTKYGRFIYATGDNALAARITGVPVRLIYTAQYAIASVIGFAAGIVVATSADSMNTRVFNSTLIYDVILVVVLGGIGLSGGKGGIRNVVIGTLLIGILLNSMTIMNIQYTQQNLIKSVILLAAIIIDSILHPRNEETAQQGDI